MRLLTRHHYLGALQPVGEQMLYVAVGPNGGWRAILVFCAAAKHLRARDRWIGWTTEQRRRRLALVANNARFLVLPGYQVPNLATRVMRLTLDRLSTDWEAQYAHPLAVVESFVDPERFQGTLYRAGGWVEVGATSGWGRAGRDYDVRHNKPKRLFVRELCPQARLAGGAPETSLGGCRGEGGPPLHAARGGPAEPRRAPQDGAGLSRPDWRLSGVESAGAGGLGVSVRRPAGTEGSREIRAGAQ